MTAEPCDGTTHVFEVDEETPEGTTPASAPDDRRCACGAWTWGAMNAKLEATEGLEALWRLEVPWRS